MSNLRSRKMGALSSKKYQPLAEDCELERMNEDNDNISSEDEEINELLECIDDERKDTKTSTVHPVEQETIIGIVIQMFFPFILAGMGMVTAGLVLDIVQHWEVFENISELFILVPALLGLKGNLEMTLASRLSTQAHLGKLDNSKDALSLIAGNLALIQCQGIVVGFVASFFAIVIGITSAGSDPNKEEFYHGLLLCAASVLTASVASFFLGIVMVVVILLSRKLNINPDNVATPIAASLGDLVTLTLLSWIANLLYINLQHESGYLAPTIIILYILVIPLSVFIASRNESTAHVLVSGWTPVILAMVISSIGGLILDKAVTQFKGIAVFQPVINGVGGNLVAVQASRISTYLHTVAAFGELPPSDPAICISPLSTLCGSGAHAKTARLLLMMVVPGQILFTIAISFFKAGHTSLTPVFLIVYQCAALIQVIILLHTAHWLIHYMWTKKIDPDNSAIPYLTALGDLLGTGLLAMAFQFLYVIGDKDSDVGD